MDGFLAEDKGFTMLIRVLHVLIFIRLLRDMFRIRLMELIVYDSPDRMCA